MRVKDVLQMISGKLAAAEDAMDVPECIRLALVARDILTEYLTKFERAQEEILNQEKKTKP